MENYLWRNYRRYYAMSTKDTLLTLRKQLAQVDLSEEERLRLETLHAQRCLWEHEAMNAALAYENSSTSSENPENFDFVDRSNSAPPDMVSVREESVDKCFGQKPMAFEDYVLLEVNFLCCWV